MPLRILKTAPERISLRLLRSARDINLAALRYVAEAVRIRLFALRYTTARRAFLATRHTASYRRGAKISWRLFCVEISAPFRSRYGAEYKFLRRRLVAIGALVDKF